MQVVRIGDLTQMSKDVGRIMTLKFMDNSGKKYEAVVLLADEETKGVLLKNVDEGTLGGPRPLRVLFGRRKKNSMEVIFPWRFSR
ncbi:hypothetical protein [Thermococcus peptonophilus]|uniref:Uncharacterized protein n=1 Tax=Thermococcus peptonophilus TaxID=53952 RepID=A0A142CV97_9EURY|nr:hypothetical protein [Thermococcus peptonophilus]AMQ18699.1 hypothetical protein A0127_05705 [Thermococcus peptonophilus]